MESLVGTALGYLLLSESDPKKAQCEQVGTHRSPQRTRKERERERRHVNLMLIMIVRSGTENCTTTHGATSPIPHMASGLGTSTAAAKSFSSLKAHTHAFSLSISFQHLKKPCNLAQAANGKAAFTSRVAYCSAGRFSIRSRSHPCKRSDCTHPNLECSVGETTVQRQTLHEIVDETGFYYSLFPVQGNSVAPNAISSTGRRSGRTA